MALLVCSWTCAQAAVLLLQVCVCVCVCVCVPVCARAQHYTLSLWHVTLLLLLQIYKGGAVLLPKWLKPSRYNYMRLSRDGDV